MNNVWSYELIRNYMHFILADDLFTATVTRETAAALAVAVEKLLFSQ